MIGSSLAIPFTEFAIPVEINNKIHILIITVIIIVRTEPTIPTNTEDIIALRRIFKNSKNMPTKNIVSPCIP